MGRGGGCDEPTPLVRNMSQASMQSVDTPSAAGPPSLGRSGRLSQVARPSMVLQSMQSSDSSSIFQAGPVLLGKLERVHACAVLRKLVEKISLLNALPVDIVERGTDISASVGDDVTRMVGRQDTLEERFDLLCSMRGILKAMPNKTKYNENQEESRKIAAELRQCTESLSRTLRDNPNVSDNVAKAAAERSVLVGILLQLLLEIEEKGTYVCLTQFVTDASEREKVMQDTIERERAATARVRALRQQLKQEREEHERVVTEKKKLLEGFKTELRTVKTTTHVEGRYSAKVYAATRLCDDRLMHEELERLEAEETLLKQKLSLEAQAYSASSDFLLRRVTEMQQEIIDWNLKHESDTQAKDKELEALKAHHVKDSAKLKELELVLAKEMELKVKRDEQIASKALQDKQERAAIRIQRAWRRYHEHKLAQRQLKSAGGKKSKSGSAKGKKK